MTIEKQYTLLGYVGNVAVLSLPLIVLVPLTLFLPVTPGDASTIYYWFHKLFWWYVVVMLALAVYRYYSVTAYMKKRAGTIRAFAANATVTKNSDAKTISIADSTPFIELAVSELYNTRNYRSIHHVYGDDWAYGDVAYDLYRRTKYGDYKSATVYYAAMTTKLPRGLPHVFFDSKKSRGRQFRFHFARSQRHSLEGNFDQHFTTYFPAGYTIDSMSFISPDVMQVMIGADAYDIEIENNTVSIFGTMKDPGTQIPEMVQKIQAIKKELLDNILTYRDERLPNQEGRKGVALAGAELKKSKFWVIFNIAIAATYIIVRLTMEILFRD